MYVWSITFGGWRRIGDAEWRVSLRRRRPWKSIQGSFAPKRERGGAEGAGNTLSLRCNLQAPLASATLNVTQPAIICVRPKSPFFSFDRNYENGWRVDKLFYKLLYIKLANISFNTVHEDYTSKISSESSAFVSENNCRNFFLLLFYSLFVL